MRHRYVPFLVALIVCALGTRSVMASPTKLAPEARLSALPKDDARAAFVLGLTLAAEGDDESAALAYARVLRIDPDHAAARRALGYARVGARWLRGEALLAARGLVKEAGTVRLAAVRAGRKPKAAAQPEAGSTPLPDAAAAYEQHLRQALQAPTPKQRAAATAALQRLRDPETVRRLGRALWHHSDDIAVHAAEALRTLGDEAGVAQLAARLRDQTATSPRAHFSQLRQVPYLRDFDVEVG